MNKNVEFTCALGCDIECDVAGHDLAGNGTDGESGEADELHCWSVGFVFWKEAWRLDFCMKLASLYTSADCWKYYLHVNK